MGFGVSLFFTITNKSVIHFAISSNSMQKNRLIENMLLLFEEIAISSKLKLFRANQNQIRNQQPRLRRNTLILGRKAGGKGFSARNCTYDFHYNDQSQNSILIFCLLSNN